MSYDVSLYDPTFLRNAISSSLGDWTSAPPLSSEAIDAIVRVALNNGFIAEAHDPSFLAFLQSQGVVSSTDYKLDTFEHRAQLQVFKNSASFSVQTSDVALASIALIRQMSIQLVTDAGLGFYDPQAGEVLCEKPH